MQYESQNARFSRCGLFRYSLARRWDSGKGRAVFIGLNPSTADASQDDPTIRRCVGFAHSWGFREMEIVNLFAFRATLPRDLFLAADPVGPRNDFWIRKVVTNADLVLACWGNDGSFQGRGKLISSRFRQLHCLHVNRTGQPAHPLYQPASTRPRRLRQGGCWQ